MTASKSLCTIAYGPHRQLLEITRPALEQYADAHGYELVVVEHRLVPSRPVSWDKVALLDALVRERELVCWIDADAIIVDASRDIADDLLPRRFFHLVEHHIGRERIPNCGVMVLRGGRTAARFLDKVWNRWELVHHRWWENAAVLDVLGYRFDHPIGPKRPSPWRLGTGLLDRSWNSVPADPAPDPRIMHFPGMTLAARLEALQLAGS